MRFVLVCVALFQALLALPASAGGAPRQGRRPRLEEVAERVIPVVPRELGAPDAVQKALTEITAQVQREKGKRGSLPVLFEGGDRQQVSLAAQMLAYPLNLGLYRIDLSRVVSKYIGETEKNLARIFDAAEESGAILFFDEGDALFGKRTEIDDERKRDQDAAAGFLLQALQKYRGLTLLAVSKKESLDLRGRRRFRHVVTFPPKPEDDGRK